MLEEANKLRAKGIIAMRYDSNQLGPNIVEVIAYGTAVFDAAYAGTAAASDASVPLHMVTTDTSLLGHSTQRSLGVPRGISVRSTNLFLSIGAGLKTIVGGEIRNYSALCETSREEAARRLMQHAAEMGATAIVGMRYQSNDLQPGVVEVVAYGTAVTDGSRSAVAAPAVEEGQIPIANVSTANEVTGVAMPISLGVVRGITVRSRNVATNIGAGLKAGFIGGEITSWTSLCEAARNEAYERLLKEATEKGARGIVGMRYETNEITPGITEVLAFGTAVA